MSCAEIIALDRFVQGNSFVNLLTASIMGSATGSQSACTKNERLTPSKS
jgi:hypothetical protein